jgi:hypothetical protein
MGELEFFSQDPLTSVTHEGLGVDKNIRDIIYSPEFPEVFFDNKQISAIRNNIFGARSCFDQDRECKRV